MKNAVNFKEIKETRFTVEHEGKTYYLINCPDYIDGADVFRARAIAPEDIDADSDEYIVYMVEWKALPDDGWGESGDWTKAAKWEIADDLWEDDLKRYDGERIH